MNKRTVNFKTLILPMPAIVLGTVVKNKTNFMTASWCGIASQEPPAVSVAVRKGRHSMRGIEEHGAFSINIADTSVVKEVDYCGMYSGKKTDKSNLFKTFSGAVKNAPLISLCPVNMECQVLHILDMQSHWLVVGQIIETHVTDTCFTDERPDPDKIDPLVWVPITQCYRKLGPMVGKGYKIGKKHQNSK